MSDGMGREFMYLSSHATNRYFIPNRGKYDAKPTYKKFLGYRPGVYVIGDKTPTTYGRDFAYCLKSHGGVRGIYMSLW